MLSVFVSLSFFSQKCASITLKNITEDLKDIDSKVFIEEDSNGDFYFSSTEDLDIISGGKISVLFNQARFLDYYKVQVKTDDNLITLSKASSENVCGDVLELRIVINQNIIQKKILKFN